MAHISRVTLSATPSTVLRDTAVCGTCRMTKHWAPRPIEREPCRAVAFSLVGTKAQTRRPLPAAPAAPTAPPRSAASDLRLRSLRLRFVPRLRSCCPGAAPSPPPASAAPLAVSKAATAAAAGFCSERGGCSGYGRGGHGRDGTAGTGEALKRRQHVVVVVIVAVAPPRCGHRSLARAATATAATAATAATSTSGVGVSERARHSRGS